MFRAAVESGEFDTIGDLFAEDAVLLDTEMRGEHAGDHALMFNATVDGLKIQGCDFVHTRADGLIDTITVMLRPLKAVSVFANKMRAELDNAGTG